MIVPFASFPNDLLNQSPPALGVEESSENCLEKNIGTGFFYRLFSNKTSRTVKRNSILKHSVKNKQNKENGF